MEVFEEDQIRYYDESTGSKYTHVFRNEPTYEAVSIFSRIATIESVCPTPPYQWRRTL
jgi:hypothetical protein